MPASLRQPVPRKGFWPSWSSGGDGRPRSTQTTLPLSIEDTLAALEKAQSIKYKPPGS
jgi:hypothetical protein